jgi:hypothetical protein
MHAKSLPKTFTYHREFTQVTAKYHIKYRQPYRTYMRTMGTAPLSIISIHSSDALQKKLISQSTLILSKTVGSLSITSDYHNL